MSAPFFSVVIPAYDRGREAAAAVRSVLAQTDRDFECFVVDDGSKDDTRARLSRFSDPRVRLILNDDNRGQHRCRNQAIRAARGRWIAFLDSDDLFLPGRLAALRRRMEHRPEVGFWFTNAYLHRYGRIVGRLFDPRRAIPEGRVPGWYAIGDEFLPYVTTTVAVRRDAFERVGYFREDLRILEDTELYARMLAAGLQVGAIHEPLAVRFLHGGQITRDHLKDFEEAMEALKSSGAPADVAARVRRKIAGEVAGYLWRGAKPEEARRFARAEGIDGALAAKAPGALLQAARALRRVWIRLRFSALLAPAEFRDAARIVDRLLSEST